MKTEDRERFANLAGATMLRLAQDPRGTWFPTKSEVVKRVVEQNPEIHSNSAYIGLLSPDRWAQLYQRLTIELSSASEVVKRVESAYDIKLEVAPTPDDVPAAAARLFKRLAPQSATEVTVSCGSTLRRMISELSDYPGDLKVYSSVVIGSDATTALPPSAVASEFLRSRRHGRVEILSYQLPARIEESFGDSPMVRRDALWKFLQKQLFKQAATADLIFLGIGVLEQAGTFSAHVADTGAKADLVTEGTIGEISFVPFDEEGRPIYDRLRLGDSKGRSERWQALRDPLATFFTRTFSLPLDRIGDDSKIVLVAGGPQKHVAIQTIAARMTPRPDYLVTDEDTLQYLAENA